MTDEAKKTRAEYIRGWRKRNPQKVKDAQARYWEKLAKKQAEYAKEQGAQHDT